MRESPEPLLLEWFENKKDNKFFISAITRAEILLGIELLPESKKKNQLKYTFDLIIEEDFRDQCLAFDEFETWSQFLIQICLLEYNA